MDVSSLFSPAAVAARLRAGSKKHLLTSLADIAARAYGIDAAQALTAVQEREKLGVTGVGNGIAIPHAKLPGLDRLIGIFVTLEQPVDYQSIDSAPVDIACMLLAPTAAGASHLQALALVSRMLRQHGLCEKLRGALNDDALLAILLRGEQPKAA